MDFKKLNFSKTARIATTAIMICAAVLAPLSASYAASNNQNNPTLKRIVDEALDGKPLQPGQTLTIIQNNVTIAVLTNNSGSPMTVSQVLASPVIAEANVNSGPAGNNTTAVNVAASNSAVTAGAAAAAAQASQAAMTA